MSLLEKKHQHDDQVVWQPVGDVTELSVDDRLRELVAVTGSLTRCLRDRCGSAFRLELLGEHKQQDAPGLIREVLMSCGDSPWVFAQTVIPQATVDEHPWLREMGNRPLGDFLSERSNVVRGGLYLARLIPGHPLYERALGNADLGEFPDALWARRSVIRINESELSINEVFFPEAGHCPKA